MEPTEKSSSGSVWTNPVPLHLILKMGELEFRLLVVGQSLCDLEIGCACVYVWGWGEGGMSDFSHPNLSLFFCNPIQSANSEIKLSVTCVGLFRLQRDFRIQTAFKEQ